MPERVSIDGSAGGDDDIEDHELGQCGRRCREMVRRRVMFNSGSKRGMKKVVDRSSTARAVKAEGKK